MITVPLGMTGNFDIDAMRTRLGSALKEKGLSRRSVSLQAGLNPGFVHSILKEGKEPTVTSLAKVCDAAGLSLGYVLYGIELSQETEALVSLIEMNPEKRDSILALLRD
ncbi:helix-turn-helix domain-containing protein [Pseudophaeobacter sp. C1-32P7]|uniref:helix-turn-helix domain-containing protein n=1 Tax=Pseudophaeobacter sp. C1-32P7 TaxID=3098142 RepID=UPI0034D54514